MQTACEDQGGAEPYMNLPSTEHKRRHLSLGLASDHTSASDPPSAALRANAMNIAVYAGMGKRRISCAIWLWSNYTTLTTVLHTGLHRVVLCSGLHTHYTPLHTCSHICNRSRTRQYL